MIYSDLYESGELRQRVEEGYRRLSKCDLCPRRCGIDRTNGEHGWCRGGLLPKVASASLHRGEEPPISGVNGSGTIFFSGCTMGCVFCQNYPISHLNNGTEITVKELSKKMLDLQKRGAHNLNFVTPSHFMPQILDALSLSVPEGLDIPIVWNCSGYEAVDALKLLEGVVSVYLPDMKYSREDSSVELSKAPGYPEINRQALLEMHRQVGSLVVDDKGLALKGVIIRHLVLPSGKAGTDETLKWISERLGVETAVSLMSQYFPAGEAFGIHSLSRALTSEEYEEAVVALDEAGLENGWVQELEEDRLPV